MRVSIFVDGANMFYTQKKGLGWFFDPAKLLLALRGDDDLTDAYWYLGVKMPLDPKDDRFIDFLSHTGFIVQTKSLKTIVDTINNTSSQKANLDVEMVIDMFNTVENYDKIIIVSGDGDFERAIKVLQDRGKRVTVVSTQNWIAKELRLVVGSRFIDLQDLRGKIERIPVATQ